MNDCGCIEKMRRLIVEALPDVDRDRPHGIREISVGIPGGEVRTMTTFDYHKPGVKKQYSKTIIHGFCPFCGKEYPKMKPWLSEESA